MNRFSLSLFIVKLKTSKHNCQPNDQSFKCIVPTNFIFKKSCESDNKKENVYI